MLQSVHRNLLTLLSSLFHSLTSATGYGVGFHLSLDYEYNDLISNKTILIFFEQRCECIFPKQVRRRRKGGSNYLQMLQAAYIPEDETFHSGQIDIAYGIQKHLLVFKSLRNYLPSWYPSWPVFTINL